MLRQVTISNEVISVDVSRELGKMIEKQVGLMRACFKDTGTVADFLLRGMEDIVATTGLTVKYHTGPGLQAWMLIPQFYGHQGTTWNAGNAKVTLESETGLKYAAKVDLKKLQVSGTIVDELKFTSCIGTGFFQGDFTDAEITAITLHEIGHAFDTFITIGDYIYLNYMLADGVDVLLGNKRNKFDLEILDHTWVVNNLEKDQREDFVNNPTPGSARRAILSLWQKSPRHYLFDNALSAIKREEQMADMFASRLGYGRAMVTGLDKWHKAVGRQIDYRTTWAGNLLRIASMVIFIPFTILWLLSLGATQDGDAASRYDPPKERLKKIKLDLITQLRTIKDRTLVDSIQEDIRVVDEILSKYHNGTSAYDAVAEFFSPSVRKERRLIEHEETLESLLNNDLFVTAQRFKS